MKVIESRAGRIVVQHEHGYTFVFQIHDVEDFAMNFERVSWPSIGSPPDADELELRARELAKAEAIAQGWMT